MCTRDSLSDTSEEEAGRVQWEELEWDHLSSVEEEACDGDDDLVEVHERVQSEENENSSLRGYQLVQFVVEAEEPPLLSVAAPLLPRFFCPSHSLRILEGVSLPSVKLF